MKAAVLKGPRAIGVEDVPKPAAGSDFLVVEVKACGISEKDIARYKGGKPKTLQATGGAEQDPQNIIPGHEFAGFVHDVANPDFKHLTGKRVGVIPFNTCGVCEYCRANLYHLCGNMVYLGYGTGWGKGGCFPGGMAEYCGVWNTHVVELPEIVSFEEAALLHPISIAVHAIAQSDLREGEDVLVIGAGTVGLSIAQAVRAFGGRKVVLAGACEASLKIARENGVDRAVDSSEADIDQFIKDQYGGVNVVFDLIGSPVSRRQAFAVLKESGRIVHLAADPAKGMYRLIDLAGEKKIKTAANSRYEDYLLALALIENGTINAKAMITANIPLEEIHKGFELLREEDGPEMVKTVLRL